MPAAIFTEGLTKLYPLPGRRGKRTAVNALDLEVPEGQVFAFLGPNGAGKTTTIKTLLGFIRPTSGRAEIFGRDIADYQARRDVGYLPEQPYFHKFLSPRETLSLHARLLGLGRKLRDEQIEAALQLTGLTEHHNIRVSKLSKGLMQRVGIAQALIGSPRLLMLDEPTSGLDPIGRREMKDLILSLKGRTTVFLSSHLLSEVEAVADQVAIVSKGNLVCVGPPDDIKQTGDTVCICCEGMTDAARSDLTSVGAQVSTAESDENNSRDQAEVRVDIDCVFVAIHILEQHGLTLASLSREQETLEDAFLRLAA